MYFKKETLFMERYKKNTFKFKKKKKRTKIFN